MASSEARVNFILSQISGAGDVRTRKMFGEYCIYCNDKVVDHGSPCKFHTN